MSPALPRVKRREYFRIDVSVACSECQACNGSHDRESLARRLAGDWWTLPLHLETYREALARVYPSQYVHICVFDRIYILGEDVLDYVRSQIPTEANLVTR